ncbi:hypothetical protein [Hydrogenophaga sp.]|uniref:hypothetical protein n=1 Tax=Hydrogenophaga sp. TaxID=1904254 RepID=UPI0027159863|nr:hypothetical protein [Hydrogenophaga sp.]MDO8903313.1 hypothetical protein [Hydrogenophaga sp.]
MTVIAAVLHLAGFLAPAFVTGSLLWLAAGLWRAGRRRRLSLGLLVLAGAAVLFAGLAYFGRDGKIATYAALVLVQGTLVWWLRRR